MKRKNVAIACQGGGSQCAFVAGALKTLFARGFQERFDIVGLSGTSGGAFTAALAWLGLLKQARGDLTPIEDRIMACWADLTAQTPLEVAFDGVCVQLLRLVERGLLPSVATSPSSPQFQFWTQAASFMLGRPEFTDLRALLVKHLDFAELTKLVEPKSPVLLVGAADVVEGSFKVFSSARDEISVDALLASAAVPNLFPAAHVEGHTYWDGIFSSNPPVAPFLRAETMGRAGFPDEIWILQVNRARHESVPETSSDILDRRNNLAGNLSLRHELQLIDIVNLLLQNGALTDEFREHLGLDATAAVTVRFIRMSRELEQRLDYPSKLSRQPLHIEQLIADGESQATKFLAGLSESDRPQEAVIDGASADAG
jgi:NTE family protein